jgi:hypothetical protein
MHASPCDQTRAHSRCAIAAENEPTRCNNVVRHSDKIYQGCCDGFISVWNDRQIVDDCAKGQRCVSARAGVFEVDRPRPSTHRSINVIQRVRNPTRAPLPLARDPGRLRRLRLPPSCNALQRSAPNSGAAEPELGDLRPYLWKRCRIGRVYACRVPKATCADSGASGRIGCDVIDDVVRMRCVARHSAHSG